MERQVAASGTSRRDLKEMGDKSVFAYLEAQRKQPGS